MEISSTSNGASAYALKKAIEMPAVILNLIKNTDGSAEQSLGSKPNVTRELSDQEALTGKGNLIDLLV